jgi:hypothetical protein
VNQTLERIDLQKAKAAVSGRLGFASTSINLAEVATMDRIAERRERWR